MGSVKRRSDRDGVRWRARYRGPDGREHSRTFDRKGDAERWLTAEESRASRGDWVDPASGRVQFFDAAESWLRGQVDIKPSTEQRYASILNVHVLPTWGRVPLARIAREDVAAWVADLSRSGLAASTVRQVHRVLALVLAEAVANGRLAKNPADGVPLPRLPRPEPRFLTAEEVHRLADAAPGHGGLLVLFLAYTGLRFGEAAALRVGRVDMLRRRATVSESVTEVNGRAVLGTPKTHQTRTVPLPRFLLDDIGALCADQPADGFVFRAPDGGHLRLSNWRRRVFDPACRAADLEGVTPHVLRHTAASLAISAGASVKDVQRMLGHASAAMTLDVYAGLFGDSLDGVADRLETVAAQARAAQVRPTGTVRALRTGS